MINYKKVLLLILITISTSVVKAQIYSSNTTESINIEIGVGFHYATKYEVGGNISIGVNKIRNNNIFRARFFYSNDLDILAGPPTYRSISHTLSIGRGVTSNNHQLWILGGVGLVSGQLRGAYIPNSYRFETNYYGVVSFPIDLDYIYRFNDSFGIGISGFVDINNVNTINGCLFKLYFGK